MFSGYVGIYRRKKYVGGHPRGTRQGRALLRGGAPSYLVPPRLLLASTSSLLDCVCSKNIAPEGFIPFGLHLIFLFCETLK